MPTRRTEPHPAIVRTNDSVAFSVGCVTVSEYQYYEFLALDRPLTSEQLETVRALSTRARITPTSFVNEYNFGDFRGEPRRLMERFYDAHLYLANWGTRHVMLRIPSALLPSKAAKPYRSDDSLEVWTRDGHTLLHLFHEPEEGGDWEESDEIPLAAIVGIRDELSSGDLRPLYLAWLVGLAAWELWGEDEEEFQTEQEPPVPPGLTQLTGPQRALADFLKLDPDLLAAAAEDSPVPARSPETGLAQWIAALPTAEKDALLLRSAQGTAPRLGPELLARYRKATVPPPSASSGRRSAADLLDAAHTLRAQREKRVAQERAEAAERGLREAAEKHEARLVALARDPEQAWRDIDRLIDAKKPAEYDTAVTLLTDLRELAYRAEAWADFDQRAAALREQHRGKPSLMRRFDAASMPDP